MRCSCHVCAERKHWQLMARVTIIAAHSTCSCICCRLCLGLRSQHSLCELPVQSFRAKTAPGLVQSKCTRTLLETHKDRIFASCDASVCARSTTVFASSTPTCVCTHTRPLPHKAHNSTKQLRHGQTTVTGKQNVIRGADNPTCSNIFR